MTTSPLARRADATDYRRLAAGGLVHLGADVEQYDYILLPYAPAVPTAGKLASVNLLRECLALMGVEAEGMQLVAALEQGLGPGRTVWGIKQRSADQPLTCELYFYDRERPGPKLGLAAVQELLAPYVSVDAELDRKVSWLMFSLEFSADDLRRRRIDSATVYARGENLTYELRGRELTLTNLYRFYDPERQTQQLLDRIAESVHFTGEGNQLARLVPPALFRCRSVCVANKRAWDAMYFSRTGWQGFWWFLEHHAWPQPIVDFAAQHKAGLDHLRWCVGFDFRLRDGELGTGKSSFYGWF